MAATKNDNKQRKSGANSAHQGLKEALSPAGEDQTCTDLHLTSRASLTDMTPGDLVFLDEISYLRESFAPNFIAVLACPRCGSPGLVTSAQLSGAGPIVCVSKLCSGQFRVVNETQLVPLPLS
jgi:hypothetical protein